MEEHWEEKYLQDYSIEDFKAAFAAGKSGTYKDFKDWFSETFEESDEEI